MTRLSLVLLTACGRVGFDSLISDWVTGPNHGIVLISTNDESSRFATSEAAPSADRPVLTVTFVP